VQFGVWAMENETLMLLYYCSRLPYSTRRIQLINPPSLVVLNNVSDASDAEVISGVRESGIPYKPCEEQMR
jgi:hypothetical protein